MSGFGWFYLGLLSGVAMTTLALTWFAARYLPREAALFAATVANRIAEAGEAPNDA